MKPQELADEVKVLSEAFVKERETSAYWSGKYYDMLHDRDAQVADLKAEVARLTVAKLPTADDYSRLVKEKHEQRARADAAELEVARLREALDSARNLAELRGQEVTKWANAAGVARGERQRLRDEVARLTTAVETATADAALAEVTIVGLEKERDAARAELARVREALNVLMSEGKKGGGA